MTFISRRDLLKRAAAMGALPLVDGFEGPRPPQAAATPHAPSREPLENLTAHEMDTLEAMVARLIPTDETGPGAAEARAAHYIDRALGGALGTSRQAYSAGLAALDRYARSSRGKAFAELEAAEQDALLTEVEAGDATGFAGSSRTFFSMVLAHTHQGTFGDPYYGGNASFVGWDLIGYPGVRTMVSATDQQRLEQNDLRANHKSAYDYDVFTKAGTK